LAEAGFLTNETVFNLTERPRRLMVIGGGPLGCEMAQAFSRLGSEVSVVVRGPQILPREDPDAASILGRALQLDGIRVKLDTTVKSVTLLGKENLVHIETEGRTEVVNVDAILAGVGRAPNVEGLNLEAAGVEHNKKGVRINDQLQTTNPRV